MANIKTYQDSKEFPLHNYERIESTGDFFFMIKGYESGDKVEADQEEMKILYNAIVQHQVISLNAKNYDIVQQGKINNSRIEMIKYALLKDIISLQISQNKIKLDGNLEIDNSVITDLLKNFRIQKTSDLKAQLTIIDEKIGKFKNDILEAEKQIEKNSIGEVQEESDINEIITNVELILERQIDMEKTSLYRFGIMQNQAKKKIELVNKQNSK